jgi:hypothetical protein
MSANGFTWCPTTATATPRLSPSTGEAIVDATLPSEVTGERARMMVLALGHESLANEAKPSVRECITSIAAAAIMCGLTGGFAVIVCPLGLHEAACDCAKVADINVSAGCDW